jgi:hypothetical protein
LTIFFSSKYNGLWASQYGNSAESTGIPGFPELGGKDSGITPDVIKVRDQANEVIKNLLLSIVLTKKQVLLLVGGNLRLAAQRVVNYHY